MKKIQKYFFILLTSLICSQSYAVCTADLDDVNFGSFVIKDTPENTINTNIQLTCAATDVTKTMTIYFSKITIDNGGNSLEFSISVNGNSLIANQNYNFNITSENMNIPVTFKILNSNNSHSSPPGNYTGTIVLHGSY